MRRKYLLQLFSGVFDYIPVHKQGKKKEYKKSTTQPNIKRIKKTEIKKTFNMACQSQLEIQKKQHQ